MSKRVTIAALAAALLLSGCTSTRGGQDIVCEGFDKFALQPKPNAIVADIQRYGVANRGGQEDKPAIVKQGMSQAVDNTIGDAAFGMSETALKQEAQRLKSLYDKAQAKSRPAGTVQISGLPQAPSRNAIIVNSTLQPSNVLLLSGGGQWGAYGAGLFLGMSCTERVSAAFDDASVPCLIDTAERKRVVNGDAIDFAKLDAMDIGIVTGVSTGSLQSLLLMVLLDKTQLKDTRVKALQQMLDSYAPEKQSELVDYDGFLAVVVRGSVAGTDALREHVTQVLQEKWGFRDGELQDDGSYAGESIPTRRLVDQIAHSPITTMVGIVEGRDGEFKSVNMKRMVNEIDLEERDEEVDRATNCVLATTLASSAMPVFHQQLRVIEAKKRGDKEPEAVTLFDGGVRRSVFISELGNAFKRRYAILASSMGRELFAAAEKNGKIPKMFVLRNGPTTSVWDPHVNNVDTAIGQALRAYELLVNELEVNSIASLRLANPYGSIMLSTADGSENREFARRDAGGNPIPGPLRPGCKKNGEMFDPSFMVCLQNFGVRRGMQLEVDKTGETIPDFWPVSSVDPRPGFNVPTPANDN